MSYPALDANHDCTASLSYRLVQYVSKFTTILNRNNNRYRLIGYLMAKSEDELMSQSV